MRLGRRTRRVLDDVLAAYLASQEAYRTTAGRIGPTTQRPELLTRTDRHILAAFHDRGTVELPTGELLRAILQPGQSRGAADALVRISPLLHQISHGVHRLRGATP